MEVTSHHQLEEFGKGQKHMLRVLPSSSLESILAEQCVHHQEVP